MIASREGFGCETFLLSLESMEEARRLGVDALKSVFWSACCASPALIREMELRVQTCVRIGLPFMVHHRVSSTLFIGTCYI